VAASGLLSGISIRCGALLSPDKQKGGCPSWEAEWLKLKKCNTERNLWRHPASSKRDDVRLLST